MLNSERLVPSIALAIFALTVGLSEPAQGAPPPKAKPASAPAAAPKSATPGKAPVSAALTAAYKSYVDSLRPKIYNTWFEKFPFGKNHVVLTVIVNQDGSASGLELASTPKSGEAEQAANDAFNAAQPLASLPSGSPPCKLVITMDSNANPPADCKTNFAMKMDPLPGAAAPMSAPASEPEPAPAAESAPPADKVDEKK